MKCEAESDYNAPGLDTTQDSQRSEGVTRAELSAKHHRRASIPVL